MYVITRYNEEDGPTGGTPIGSASTTQDCVKIMREYAQKREAVMFVEIDQEHDGVDAACFTKNESFCLCADWETMQ